MDDSFARCAVGSTSLGIIHDQGPVGTAGLKADVRMIEVSASRSVGAFELVVKIALGRDRPLTCKRRAVREWIYGLGQTVPMLRLGS